MIRQLRMSAFHVRQFVSVPYFIQLMVTTTLATALVQFLSFRAFGTMSATQGWVRAGIIGMWTTATCAAGIIGFERYKGTLVYLVSAPIGALRSLAAVVASAGSFGLAAFPVAWVTWALCSASVTFTAPSWGFACGVLLLWIGYLSVSFVIAALFVLTPNAISYEGLLLVPMFLASGILFTTTTPPAWLAYLSFFVPLSMPTSLLFGEAITWSDVAIWAVVLGTWLAAAGVAGRAALRRATRSGTLEVM